MPRTPRPWFSAEKGWWMVHHAGKKVRLAKGRENKKEAERKFRELLYLRDQNPAPDSGQHTVASVIELYLRHAAARYAERTLYERRIILQALAEANGFRRVNDHDCLPFHLTSFLDDHPAWKSDWTRQHAVAVVQRPFNWAAKQRLIPSNPFRGVSHRQGVPRRPLSRQESSAPAAALVRPQRWPGLLAPSHAWRVAGSFLLFRATRLSGRPKRTNSSGACIRASPGAPPRRGGRPFA